METKMTKKEILPLIGMTVSAFIFNTSEFMPIGLLTDIAKSFEITEAKAGMLITVYSWIVMLLSLPLMILVSRIDYRRLFMGTVAVFGICQVLTVLSNSYGMLMASRIGVACAHAIFWSIASPIAVRMASEAHQSKALSMVVTGTSVATIAGLPLGKMVGHYAGWRIAFLIVAVITFGVLVYMAFLFPKMDCGEPFRVKQLPQLFKNRSLVCVYIQTFLFVVGYYTSYSYIDPFLQQVAGMGNSMVTITLFVFGAAGLFGSFLFSKFYDRYRRGVLRTVMAALVVELLLLLPAAGKPGFMMALCALWGITVLMFNVSFQSETIQCTDEQSSSVAMSIFSGIFNFGIGAGSFLGGIVCDKGQISHLGFVGAVFATISLLFFLICMSGNLVSKEYD
ncbi:MAG: sugar transporter [Lachnospiraceae bacterium]|nr:sugar transporter [Lachnospiraceae bacterium]